MKKYSVCKSTAMAILFAAVMLFAFAANTSECEADTTTTEVAIECGSGHEDFAVKLGDELDMDSNEELNVKYNSQYFILNTRADVTGTKVTVSCPDTSLYNGNTVTIGALRKGISQTLTRMSGNSQYVDVAGYTEDNGELLWNSQVGFASTDWYQNFGGYDAYQEDIENLSNLSLYAYNSGRDAVYLLWEKPSNQTINVTVDTPLCGSTDGPAVTCDALSFITTYASSEPVILPIWLSKRPENGLINWKDMHYFSYKGALEGGIPYYAYAAFKAPWGYYFPYGFNNVTVNGQPADDADVWVETHENTHEHLYVGAEITPEHVWSAWKTVKKPTALNTGLQQRVCQGNAAHVEKHSLPATGVNGTLLTQMTAKGKNKLNLSWTKVSGAEGYDIFFAKCNTKKSKEKLKLVKTIKGNSTFAWAKSGLKKKTAYKAQVKAFAYKNGKKTYVKTSPDVHVFTSGVSGKYTNAKSVSVNMTSISLQKGGAFQIKGKVAKLKKKKKLMPKSHGPTLRYCSTNNAVATVNTSGKITAKTAGKCTVYVFAVNGVRNAVAVTVK